MKCPYGTQHWNHFLKATTKQNQYKLHLIQFVEKKKKDNSESGFILINELY